MLHDFRLGIVVCLVEYHAQSTGRILMEFEIWYDNPLYQIISTGYTGTKARSTNSGATTNKICVIWN